jgi:hypothetical protein
MKKPQDHQIKETDLKDDDLIKAANRVRMQAAAGECFICLEDKPNIATLCCGKAVHFNCMAKWLRQNASCPQCREKLPNLDASDDENSTSSDDEIRYPRMRRPFEHSSRSSTGQFMNDSNFDPRSTDDGFRFSF